MSPSRALKVKKDSHSIRKPSPSSSASSTSSISSSAAAARTPVIIYASSPKVIHTEPGNFMALVQKLTGLSGSAAASSVANGEVSSDNVTPGPALPLPPTEDVVSPVEDSSAATVPMVNMGCSDFLDSPLFMDAELMEMIAPPVDKGWGWNFGLEDDECLF